MAKSPVAIPFSTDSVELAVKDATAVPTDARGQIIVGLDGSTTRFVNVDSSGRVFVSSPQLPATLVGGRLDTNLGAWLGSTVPTVGQKIMASSIPVVFSSDQSSLGVTGTVTANQGTPGTHTNRWMIGLSDGVSAFISPATDRATAAAPFSVRLSDGAAFYNAPTSSQLPSSLVGGRLDTNLGAWLGSTAPTVGSKVSASSVPVVIASDQGAVPVSGTVTANIGTTNGLALDVTLTGGTQRTKVTDGTNNAAVKAASTAAAATDPALVVAISPNNTVPVSAASLPLPSGAATETTLGTRLADSTFTARINTLGQKTMANSTPFVIASDQSEVASKNAVSSQVDGHSVSIGATTDADTANTVIGRLKQIITRLAGGLPAALVGGRLDSNIGAWLGSTVPTVGQKAMVNSIPVVFPNDQIIAVTTSPTTAVPSLAFGDVALAAITTSALYRTAYTEQSANFTGSIASSSANDTAAGTGARTVRIFYIDATGTTAGTEDVTLNGVAFVNLVTSTKCFIEKIEVLTVGSTLSNVGILTLKTGAAGAGTTVVTIGATDNRTFLAHHYVVTGKTANVTGILIGSNVTNTVGSCIGFLRSKVIGSAVAVEKQISDGITVAGLDSSVFRSYGSQIQVPGPARITLYVTTFTGSAFNYRGSFDSYDA